MNLRIHEDAGCFLEAAQAALEEQEATNSLILGLSMRLRGTSPAPAPFWATVSGSQGLALAALMTPPHNVILAGDGEGAAGALEMVGRALLAGGWPVPGAVGPCGLVDRFASLWAEMAGVTPRMKMGMRLYRLDRVIPPVRPVAGRFRPAMLEDLDVVAPWIHAFHIDVQAQGEPADTRDVAIRRIGAGEIYLWEDGRPVSMAAWGRPTRNGVSVSMVYTPPEQRGQGYAGVCVARLSSLLLDAGYKFCVLFADVANPISNHIYRRMGYAPVCDFGEYAFDQA